MDAAPVGPIALRGLPRKAELDFLTTVGIIAPSFPFPAGGHVRKQSLLRTGLRNSRRKHRLSSLLYTLVILCAVATGVGAYMMGRRLLNLFFS